MDLKVILVEREGSYKTKLCSMNTKDNCTKICIDGGEVLRRG